MVPGLYTTPLGLPEIIEVRKLRGPICNERKFYPTQGLASIAGTRLCHYWTRSNCNAATELPAGGL
jgi:hypothetical protein